MVWREKPIVIRRRHGWRGLDLRRVWAHRDLVLLLGERELRLRYRQTALGLGWVVLQPLLGAAVIAFVFGRLAGIGTDGVPYFVLAFAGLQGWFLFSNTLTKATTCLVNQPQLVTKVAFPRLVIPLSTAIPPAVDFAVSLVVLVPLLHFHGLRPSAMMLLLPMWAASLLALALGLGFFLSSLSVAYRDVPHVVPFFLQMLLFASPVAYPISAVPATARSLYRLNPLAVLLDGLRETCLGRLPAPDGFLALAVAVSGAVFVCGWLFFARSEATFADVI